MGEAVKLHERQLLIAVLVAHQRKDIHGCICGWAKVGRSHPEHVVDCYDAALHGSDG